MDEKQFQAQMERIYAYNRKWKAEQHELVRLRDKAQRIRELLPPPGKILKVREFVELVKQLHQIVEEAGL